MTISQLLFLGSIGMPEVIILALIVLLLFGGKKIPELMKGLGKGVKSFKDGVNGIEKDLNADLDVSADDKKKN
ncbi:MAG: Sec-independent protein translocase TatA [Prevotella sp. AG:487_50_53]|jgi:sec-independent protein translocase protein TatA|nr:twin-arginine translocase TatA/TatE family subunit [Leyella lascolaii]OKZ25040.1 MAG: Sec-independent protein translocase TatA [Prevotella sp. AG:487_50_53]